MKMQFFLIEETCRHIKILQGQKTRKSSLVAPHFPSCLLWERKQGLRARPVGEPRGVLVQPDWHQSVTRKARPPASKCWAAFLRSYNSKQQACAGRKRRLSGSPSIWGGSGLTLPLKGVTYPGTGSEGGYQSKKVKWEGSGFLWDIWYRIKKHRLGHIPWEYRKPMQEKLPLPVGRSLAHIHSQESPSSREGLSSHWGSWAFVLHSSWETSSLQWWFFLQLRTRLGECSQAERLYLARRLPSSHVYMYVSNFYFLKFHEFIKLSSSANAKAEHPTQRLWNTQIGPKADQPASLGKTGPVWEGKGALLNPGRWDGPLQMGLYSRVVTYFFL